eukprot:1061990-Prymnesium_polylepis.1
MPCHSSSSSTMMGVSTISVGASSGSAAGALQSRCVTENDFANTLLSTVIVIALTTSEGVFQSKPSVRPGTMAKR